MIKGVIGIGSNPGTMAFGAGPWFAKVRCYGPELQDGFVVADGSWGTGLNYSRGNGKGYNCTNPDGFVAESELATSASGVDGLKCFGNRSLLGLWITDGDTAIETWGVNGASMNVQGGDGACLFKIGEYKSFNTGGHVEDLLLVPASEGCKVAAVRLDNAAGTKKASGHFVASVGNQRLTSENSFSITGVGCQLHIFNHLERTIHVSYCLVSMSPSHYVQNLNGPAGTLEMSMYTVAADHYINPRTLGITILGRDIKASSAHGAGVVQDKRAVGSFFKKFHRITSAGLSATEMVSKGASVMSIISALISVIPPVAELSIPAAVLAAEAASVAKIANETVTIIDSVVSDYELNGYANWNGGQAAYKGLAKTVVDVAMPLLWAISPLLSEDSIVTANKLYAAVFA